MIQNVFRETGGIALYGLVSMILFVTVFTGALIWACLQRRSVLQSIEVLPLADDQPLASKKGDVRDE